MARLKKLLASPIDFPETRTSTGAAWRALLCHVARTVNADLGGTIELLGGQATLGKRVGSVLDFVPLLHKGLPWRSFEAATKTLELTPEEVSRTLRIAPRTLARRKKARRPLTTDESERLLRL